MTKIMIAEELFGKHFNGLHYEDVTKEKIEQYAIEFAKYHVRKALKQASEDATAGDNHGYYSFLIDKDSILQSYCLDDIV